MAGAQKSRFSKALHRCFLNCRTGQFRVSCPRSSTVCSKQCMQRGVQGARRTFQRAQTCSRRPSCAYACILAGLVVIILHLVAFAAVWPSFVEHFNKQSVLPRYERDSGLAMDPYRAKFTLVTQVYSRPWISHLQAFVSNYTRSEHVAAVVFVWNCPFQDPPNQADIISHVPVRFVKGPARNSMNNRFKSGRPAIKTECICLIDDDLIISVEDVDRLFKVWNSYPSRLVGFLPRSYTTDYTNTHHYQYRRDDGTYSFILVGASMFHRSYMAEYWSPHVEPMRKYVDRVFNCDDVLMNMIVANKTNAPPIQVAGEVISIMNLTTQGLSEDGNWLQARDDCLNDLVRLFGHQPFKWNKFMIEPAMPSGVMPLAARNALDADYEGYCGEVLLQEMDTTPVTAVISTVHAAEFDPIIISKLMSYRWISEIIVINGDKASSFSSLLMEYTPRNGAKLRLLVDDGMRGDWGRFHGCTIAENTVCYLQSDEVLPHNLDALRSAFMAHPAAHHVVLTPGQVSKYRYAQKYDDRSGMFVAPIPLGHGVMMSRESVLNYKRMIKDTALFRQPQIARRLADMSYGIFSNVLPVPLVMRVAFVNDSMPETPRPRRTHPCWNPEPILTDVRVKKPLDPYLCTKHIKAALTMAKQHLMKDKVPGSIAVPPFAHDHLINYGAGHEKRFFYKASIGKPQQETDHHLHRTIDGDDDTEWVMEYRLGDFFGFDVLEPVFIDQVEVHANGMDTDAWTVEHTCDMKQWERSADLVHVETLNLVKFDPRETVVLRAKNRGTFFARAIRFRAHRAPYRVNGIDNAFAIRELRLKPEEDSRLLQRQSEVFVISTQYLQVSSYRELMARSSLLRRAVQAAAQGEVMMDVVFINHLRGWQTKAGMDWMRWLREMNLHVHHLRFPFHRNTLRAPWKRNSAADKDHTVFMPNTLGMQEAYSFMHWMETSELIHKAQVVHFDAAIHEMYFVLQRKSFSEKIKGVQFVAHMQAPALLGLGDNTVASSVGCPTLDDFFKQFMGRKNLEMADKVVVNTRYDGELVLTHLKATAAFPYSQQLADKIHVLPPPGMYANMKFSKSLDMLRRNVERHTRTPFLNKIIFVERVETTAAHVIEFVRLAYAMERRLSEISIRKAPAAPAPRSASRDDDGAETDATASSSFQSAMAAEEEAGVKDIMRKLRTLLDMEEDDDSSSSSADDDDFMTAMMMRGGGDEDEDDSDDNAAGNGDRGSNDPKVRKIKPCHRGAFRVDFFFFGKKYADLVRAQEGAASVEVVEARPNWWVARWIWYEPGRYIYYVPSSDGLAAQRITDVLQLRHIPFVPAQYEDLIAPRHREHFVYHEDAESSLIRLLNRASEDCNYGVETISGPLPLVHELNGLSMSRWINLQRIILRDGMLKNQHTAVGAVSTASLETPPLVTLCLFVKRHPSYITSYLANLEALHYPRLEVLVWVYYETRVRETYTFRGKEVHVLRSKDARLKRSVMLGSAHGEFVVFLEADTFLRPDVLSTMTTKCKQERCDAMSGWLLTFRKIDRGADGIEVLERYVVSSAAGEACGIMANCVGMINGMLFRRKALIDFGLFEGADTAESDGTERYIEEGDWLKKFAMTPNRRLSLFPKVVADVYGSTGPIRHLMIDGEPNSLPLKRNRVDFMLGDVHQEHRSLFELPLQDFFAVTTSEQN